MCMTVDLFMVWNSVFVAWNVYPKKEQNSYRQFMCFAAKCYTETWRHSNFCY